MIDARPRRGGAPRWAAAAAVVLLLLVVALAARPGGGAVAGPGESASRFVFDTALMLVVALDVLLIVALVWAAWGSEGLSAGAPPRRRGWFVAMLQGLLLVWLLAALLRLRIPGFKQPVTFFEILGRIRASVAGQVPPAAGRQNPGFDWAALGVVAAILALAAAYTWWRLRPGPRRPPPAALRPQVAGAVQAAIAGMAAERDPRRAVIAAYAGMEVSLAEQGVARRAAEAPAEYLGRVMQAARLPAAPVGRLSGLYLVARFSEHPVDESMRHDAEAALEEIRAALEAA